MKGFLERWGVLFGIAVVVGGGAWAIRSAIAEVRTELGAEIADVRIEMADVRIEMAEIRGQLDLLIHGLNIEVGPKMAEGEEGS